MLKNMKRITKATLVAALMMTTLSGGVMVQAAGPGGPGDPRMEQRMDRHDDRGFHQDRYERSHHEAPPPRYHDNDNSTAELALGIAAITAAVVIANS